MTKGIEIDELKASLLAENNRCLRWEERAKTAQESSDYDQQQLVVAHALVGRITHQLSERWDSVNLTKYHPTDNLHRFRTVSTPAGKK